MNCLSTDLTVSDHLPVTDARLFTAILHTTLQLKSHAAQLEELAAQAIEPNVFYEPWMLFPALEHYAGQSRLQFVLIFASRDGGNENSQRQLIGFFPLEEKRLYRNLPVQHLVMWRHPHCYLSTPLLHRDHAATAVGGFSRWFHENSRYRLIELTQMSGSGFFFDALNNSLLQHRKQFCCQDYERALFRLSDDFHAYMRANTSNSFRKTLRRKRRALEVIGTVEYRELTPFDDPDTWISHFLALETSGWKGRAGTALATARQDRAFFSTICRASFARRRLAICALFLDDKPIAMAINLLAGEGAFCFKVAYDEHYRVHSPGVLLDVEMIQRLHQNGEPQWLDSCTDFNIDSFNRLFVDRKPIRNLMVSNNNIVGNTLVKVIPALKRIRGAEH